MPRRKKQPPQSKLQHITDASGWTHVIKGPPGLVDPRTTDKRLQHGKAAETKYTLETYLDRFRNHYTPTWRESSCFKSLTRILEQDILPAENILITQCICLGLGSMTTGSESSSYELAALVSMLDLIVSPYDLFLPPTHPRGRRLQADPGNPPGKTHPIQEITFQDPIFTSLDQTILKALGHTVVETPHAFSKLNDTTLLFAPHLECLHYATALEVATPALSVGSDVQIYIDGLLSSLAETTKEGSCQIFRSFMAKVNSRQMPNFERTPWCESTCIFWKESKQDNSGESRIEQGVRSIELAER
ncbi:hypothetical protein BDR22DRAFT_826433 [Usnea florida]